MGAWIWVGCIAGGVGGMRGFNPRMVSLSKSSVIKNGHR